jgi:hypothetical protein
MRNIIKSAAGAAFMMAAFVVPVQAQYAGGHGQQDQYGSPHEMPHDDVPQPRSVDAGSKAEDLRLKGKCDQALPLLRGIVSNGGASEIAKFNLGLCLLDLAAVDTAHAADMKKEATEWIVEAADAGLARAQARAVTLLLDGAGGQSDPVEAQKWALLYRANPTRYNFGLPDLPDDVTARLDKMLTGAQRSEARKRANAWMPKTAAEDE